ncbi:SNF2 family N-terminal domain-containing protein [Gorgonomyces haynaldii]|nr:SNF2 family N-terminal domain-containing protein [Gorgonomyces haynaldii]
MQDKTIRPGIVLSLNKKPTPVQIGSTISQNPWQQVPHSYRSQKNWDQLNKHKENIDFRQPKSHASQKNHNRNKNVKSFKKYQDHRKPMKEWTSPPPKPKSDKSGVVWEETVASGTTITPVKKLQAFEEIEEIVDSGVTKTPFKLSEAIYAEIAQEQRDREKQERDREETTTEKQKTDREEDLLLEAFVNLSVKDQMTIELKPHQIKGLNWIIERTQAQGGCILGDDMGLGKTVQTIAWILSEPLDLQKKTLIVMPLALLSQWKQEILDKGSKELQIGTFHGPKRSTQFDNCHIILTTFDTLMNESKKNTRFMGLHWHRLILDESHIIRNTNTAKFEACFRVKSKYRLCLTGTLINNSLDDLLAAFKFLRFKPFDDPLVFENRITRLHRYQSNESKKALAKIMDTVYLRRTKKDLLLGIPDIVFERIQVDFDSKEKTAYYDRSLKRRGYGELVRKRQVASNPKVELDALLDSLSNLNVCDCGKCSKCTVLSQDELEMLSSKELTNSKIFMPEQRLSNLVKDCTLVCNVHGLMVDHGGLAQSKKEQVLYEFKNTNTMILLASLTAVAVGLNLTAANHVFFMDNWWNPTLEDQATARVHRMGQTRTVYVTKLILKESVEVSIRQKQIQKQELIDLVSENPFSKR